MEKVLILNYERFLCSFFPEIKEKDSKKLSSFNAEVGKRLSEKSGVYEYSISATKHLPVKVVYCLKDEKNIESLVQETTQILEDSAKKSELPGEDYFVLNNSRLVPKDIYSAEIQKKVINTFFK